MSFKERGYYSREQIKSVVGGAILPALVRSGEIVAVCLRRDMNPEAPEIYLNGNGINMIRDFNILCIQTTPFPVFVKENDRDTWQSKGNYLVDYYKTDSATINTHKKNSGRNDIYAVVFLKKVN